MVEGIGAVKVEVEVRKKEGKDGYMEGEEILPPVSPTGGFQRGFLGFFYRPSEGPAAKKQGLATLPITYKPSRGRWAGSFFSPRQDVSNLMWVARLTEERHGP